VMAAFVDTILVCLKKYKLVLCIDEHLKSRLNNDA
jgi:hypothetical protein